MQKQSWTLCLRRLSTAWLLGLLALGPFLHAHFGHASTEGFHIDGLQWHSHLQGTDAMSFTADDDHDAPAIGISASLTRESHHSPKTQDLLTWACALVLLVLPLWPIQLLRQAPTARARPARLYRLAGYPPPALSPPARS